MNLPADIRLLEVWFRNLAPAEVIDWHAHRHEEFCLILDGTPTVGHGAGKIVPRTATLLLFKEGEMHGVWNSGPAPTCLWLLEFRIDAALRDHFRELFERSPQERVLKLSPSQRQRFSYTLQKLTFEKHSPDSLKAFAESAWLTLLLVNMTRWLVIQPKLDFADGKEEIDPQCLELWQKIHRQVFQSTSSGPMLFGLNPSHDSLRHRFRKIFGISPQGMLLRLRMDRAKELLQTSGLSVKEIAHEIGYSRQHDLTRAFHKYIGTSPSEWKNRSRDA